MLCGHQRAHVQCIAMFLQLVSEAKTSDTWAQNVHVGQNVFMGPCLWWCYSRCPLTSWVFISIGWRALARRTCYSLAKGFHLGMGLRESLGRTSQYIALGNPEIAIHDRQVMFRTSVLVLQLGWHQWTLYITHEVSLVIVTLVAPAENFFRDTVFVDFLMSFLHFLP